MDTTLGNKSRIGHSGYGYSKRRCESVTTWFINKFLPRHHLDVTVHHRGMIREDAYALVQENAMKVWKEKIDFKNLLKHNNKIIKFLSESDIDKLFDLDKILININKIYNRIGIK